MLSRKLVIANNLQTKYYVNKLNVNEIKKVNK